MDFDRPPPDPIAWLSHWLEDAKQTGVPNPNAMALATADPRPRNGPKMSRPSARIVLLKDLDQRGAVFFTNRLSRKGRELGLQPYAALLFHWDTLNRQVRIEGEVAEVSDAESDAYFATRPRESQIAAWASRQSEPARDRAELDAAVAEVERRFAGRTVTRPPHWGGYRVGLDLIEFWQGHPFRMHDRVAYTRDAAVHSGWSIRRLYP
jgi:pyridoxamine 5'-phosphate oxidase